VKNIKPLNSKINEEEYQISEFLNYHLKHEIGLLESVLRIGSDSWLNCINEARILWEERSIELEEDDLFLIQTDAGKKEIFEGEEVLLDVPFEIEDFEEDSEEDLYEGEYQGKKVELNKPRRMSGKHKFTVFTRGENGKVVKVQWGQPGATVKNYDPEASRSFRARHKCKTPGPRWKARWWACNVGRYAKLLGLKSNKPW
jgi:hypothetical protein